MITRAFFLNLFPEFNDIGAGRINAVIGIAHGRLGEAAWGDCFEYAQALLTAHMLASALSGNSMDGGTGPITSQSVGDLSESFGQLNVSDSDSVYTTTKYGVEFLALRKECVIAPILTRR